METTGASSLQTFIDITDQSDWHGRIMLFRGQTKKGSLLPSIARQTPEYDSTQLERTMLSQFRLMGASITEVPFMINQRFPSEKELG